MIQARKEKMPSVKPPKLVDMSNVIEMKDYYYVKKPDRVVLE